MRQDHPSQWRDADRAENSVLAAALVGARSLPILDFNEADMVRKLGSIKTRLRTAFAAACAERLAPAYDKFFKVSGRGDARKLGQLRERLWGNIEGRILNAPISEEEVDACMDLIPSQDDAPWVPEQAYAEDAAAALAYALRCWRTDDPQEAAWAARRAFEAVDQFVIRRERINLNDPNQAGRVASHQIVQAELARQKRDLDELTQVSAEGMLDLIIRIRDRAQREAPHVFSGANRG